MVDDEGNPRDDVLIFDDVLVCHWIVLDKIIDTVAHIVDHEGLSYDVCVPWRPLFGGFCV